MCLDSRIRDCSPVLDSVICFKADVRRWRRLLPFSEVAGAVSEAKGEPWDAFADRYGDSGRDWAIVVARKRCGFTLREMGEHAGMKDKAVSYACAAIGKRLEKDRELGLLYQRVLEKLAEAENWNPDTQPLCSWMPCPKPSQTLQNHVLVNVSHRGCQNVKPNQGSHLVSTIRTDND